jgi:hypothetical protein
MFKIIPEAFTTFPTSSPDATVLRTSASGYNSSGSEANLQLPTKLVMQRLLAPCSRSIPDSIIDHILGYYNPHKESFTKNIIQKTDLWEKTWLHWYRTQENPLVQFVMEYLFTDWNIELNECPPSTELRTALFGQRDKIIQQLTQQEASLLNEFGAIPPEAIDNVPSTLNLKPRLEYLPSDFEIDFRVLEHKTVVSVFNRTNKGIDFILFGDIYDNEQYSVYCREYVSPDDMQVTIYWDDNYSLVLNI